MTTSHPQAPRRGALLGAIVAGGLLAALAAPVQATPLTPAPAVAEDAGITVVQYGWGRHHHHRGWGRHGHHHHYGWGRHRHWGHHHHHHRGWGRHRGWGHRHGHWH